MKIALFSNNAKKLNELSEMFSDFDVSSYVDVVGHSIDVVEDGDTFEANALKKVAAMPDRDDVIYLADDSGLVVDALDGAPGIYSARYAGEGASKEEMCRKILDEMEGVQDRSARFMCVIALKFPGGELKAVSGAVEGRILDEMKGEQGFGYDPVFCPEGFLESFGEMSAVEKHGLSHRGKALKKAASIIDQYLLDS